MGQGDTRLHWSRRRNTWEQAHVLCFCMSSTQFCLVVIPKGYFSLYSDSGTTFGVEGVRSRIRLPKRLTLVNLGVLIVAAINTGRGGGRQLLHRRLCALCSTLEPIFE